MLPENMLYTVMENKTTVWVADVFVIPEVVAQTLKLIDIEILGESGVYKRNAGDFQNKYVRVFYAKELMVDGIEEILGYANVGVEDLDEPKEPDGWTDISIPIFYGIAQNQGHVMYPIIFIDAAMGGAYAKKLLLNGKMLLTYSVEHGMRVLDKYPTSVGYIEYDPITKQVYNIID